MGNQAYNSPELPSVPNHTVNPITGFIESNGFIDCFDSAKKLAFLKVFKQNGLKFYRSCDELGLKDETVKKHLRIDPVFKTEYERVRTEYFDELEGVSRVNALNPKSVIERIFQLKAAFPERYGDGKRENSINVSINLAGKDLNKIDFRESALNVTGETKAEIEPKKALELDGSDGDI